MEAEVTLIETSEKFDKVAAALVAVAKEVTDPAKNKTNPHFKSSYVDLTGVLQVVRPLLAKNDVAIIQTVDSDSGGYAMVRTMLLHSTGQFIANTCAVPMTKRDAQGMGSAITYGRRYSISSMLGIASDEDDDGNSAASGEEEPKGRRGRASQPPAQDDRREPEVDTSSWPPPGGCDQVPNECVHTMDALLAKGPKGRPITTKQVARFWAIARNSGWDKEDLGPILQHLDLVDEEGNPSTKLIPQKIYDAFCLAMERYQKTEP